MPVAPKGHVSLRHTTPQPQPSPNDFARHRATWRPSHEQSAPRADALTKALLAGQDPIPLACLESLESQLAAFLITPAFAHGAAHPAVREATSESL
jgi:hypothetical protein